MKQCLASLFILACLVVPVQAHFIFIAPADDGRTAQIVFSEGPEVDEVVPITKIAQTQAFLRGYGESATSLKLIKKGNSYRVTLPKAKSHTVGGTCVYGVLDKGGDPFLLNYYAKAVCGQANQKETSSPWKKLPLEIVVSGGQGKVLWQGRPVPDAEVYVNVPGEERRIKTTTDKSGSFTFALPKQPGLLSFRARHVEEKAGKYQGKKYKVAKHYATLVVPGSVLLSKSGTATGSEDPGATKLLKEAREARMEWIGFPGFTADLEVNHNGEVFRGSVSVSDLGRVTVEGFKNKKVTSWLRRQLGSLVAHRMSNAADRDTPCTFLDENKHHPLGRKIGVLNDELHSSYRIRDRQIIEVNRSMKSIRFTITVLKNYETPEKKFLPAYYVVNTWSNKTGQLIGSSSHYNTWKRISKYDLPERVMVVTAKEVTKEAPVSTNAAAQQTSSLDVWTLQLRNHKLLPRE